MSENLCPVPRSGSLDSWEQLFEAALLERDPAMLEQRLQDAKTPSWTESKTRSILVLFRIADYCLLP